MPFLPTDDERILLYLGATATRDNLISIQQRLSAVRPLGEPIIKAAQGALSNLESISEALREAVINPKSVSSDDFEELRKEGRRIASWLANLLDLEVSQDYFGTFEAGQVALIPNSQRGIAGGVATLDTTAKLTTNQIPSSITSHLASASNPHQVTLAQVGGINLASLSASSPLSYNSATGAFAIQQASSTQPGFLSSSDWVVFNNKVGSIDWASPGAIGSTTPNSGRFTTLQLGTGGPLFRNNAGTIEARDAANSAVAPFNCGALGVTGKVRASDDLIASNGSHTITLGSTGANGTIRASSGSLQFSSGGSTPISVSGTVVSVLATTASTSTTTGALTVAGGFAVQGAANIGGNASVGSLTVNGGLYVRQQAVPSSPVTGQRWDEVDASGLDIQSWYYDATINGGSWISTRPYVYHFSANGGYFFHSLAGGADAICGSIAVPQGFSHLLLVGASFTFINSNVSATNFYTQQIIHGASQSVAFSVDRTTPAGNWITSSTSGSIFFNGANSGATISYRITATGASPPINFLHFASISYRGIR